MKSFFKRQTKKSSRQVPKKGVLARNFETGYRFVQSKWVKWMTKTFGMMPRARLILIAALFVIFSAGYSGYLVFINIYRINDVGFTTDHIARPNITPIAGFEPSVPTKTVIADNGASSIARYRRYMDSLARSPAGKHIYDSIMRHRPGLYDSIKALEAQYKSKTKK